MCCSPDIKAFQHVPIFEKFRHYGSQIHNYLNDSFELMFLKSVLLSAKNPGFLVASTIFFDYRQAQRVFQLFDPLLSTKFSQRPRKCSSLFLRVHSNE
jgi:hypothetical protein